MSCFWLIITFYLSHLETVIDVVLTTHLHSSNYHSDFDSIKTASCHWSWLVNILSTDIIDTENMPSYKVNIKKMFLYIILQ